MHSEKRYVYTTEHREDQSFAEARDEDWQAIFVNETWRESKEELWRHTEQGHVFLGAGGMSGERGVAIILHKTVASGVKYFRAVSERLAVADVNVSKAKCD